jgi:hypothetical protein
MQLCKIMQANRSMLPPKFNDWRWWVTLQNKLQARFGLREKIHGMCFRVGVMVVIIVTFVNCILALFTSI